MAHMVDAGLDVSVDAIGNTWGRWPAGSPPALVVGSHIDAVPDGGKFDGTLGVLGAIEAVRVLRAAGFIPKREIRIVAWIEEEGWTTGQALLGSRAFAGGLSEHELAVLAHHVTSSSDHEEFDATLELLADASLKSGDIWGYLELHVEQGPVLWESETPIGVVTGIVALQAGYFDLHGVTNHAGATPMNRRKDALVAASEVTLAVRDAAIGCGVRATCGALDLGAAASNVIPGYARVSLDVRSADQLALRSFWSDLEGALVEIRSRTGVSIDFSSTYSLPAEETDAVFQEHIKAAADALSLRNVDIPSGAIHDAMPLASSGIPVGMLFVPSEQGISHAPDEWTNAPDCRNGAAVLALAIERLTS